MKEFELIERLTRSLHSTPLVIVGPGDDCAVIDLQLPERLVVLKTDAIVQGIHFLASDKTQQLGHKALARSLSAIAAIGGTTGAALNRLGMPGQRALVHAAQPQA